MKSKMLASSISAFVFLYNFAPAHSSTNEFSFPDEIVAQIFSYLSPSASASVATTSHQFCAAATDRIKQFKNELIHTFCQGGLNQFDRDTQNLAKKMVTMPSAPGNITADQFAEAKLKALNLLINVTLNTTIAKEYAKTFKTIYGQASSTVREALKGEYENLLTKKYLN